MLETKDAVMVHGYGWKKTAAQENRELEEARRRNPEREITIYDVSVPSEIGDYGVDATVAINTANYVAAGGSFWNHTLTSSQTYTHAIKNRLPQASVIDMGGARTTSMEIRKLVKVAKKNGWKNLATVAVGVHHERAVKVAAKIERKRRVRRKGITIEVFAAEDILSNPQVHGGGEEGRRIADDYRKRFEEIKASEPYQELMHHERKAMKIEKWHLTRIADFASRVFRPKVMSK